MQRVNCVEKRIRLVENERGMSASMVSWHWIPSYPAPALYYHHTLPFSQEDHKSLQTTSLRALNQKGDVKYGYMALLFHTNSHSLQQRSYASSLRTSSRSKAPLRSGKAPPTRATPSIAGSVPSAVPRSPTIPKPHLSSLSRVDRWILRSRRP